MSAALADLSGLHDLHVAADPTAAWPEYRALIEDAIINAPRSQQRRIGPSELGTPCLLCLGRKLAGIPERPEAGWFPTIGTAVHAWLDEVFAVANRGHQHARWLTELSVDVGDVDGTTITGHCDLYDRATASVNDWKVVGDTKLKSIKSKGPGQDYRVQAHLYGRGMVRRGLPVDTVRVIFLPRNAATLDTTRVWHEPYDETVALDALGRADALAKAIRLAGPDVVLPGLTATPGCRSCPRYGPPAAPPALADLLGR
ncbi:hypothetical protein [Enterococcus hirae]|uniref:hypothetical protein n=1 Tax=Enterococcus hirae TaxID=1354 RepID=UPI001371F691|nr:hypothetical protein [Enterococcus hirae]NAE18286.1 hypothetical protein [Enterococcus hirae]